MGWMLQISALGSIFGIENSNQRSPNSMCCQSAIRVVAMINTEGTTAMPVKYPGRSMRHRNLAISVPVRRSSVNK